jgi:arginine decarboxylase
VQFDPNTNWDEREKIFKMSGKIVRTFNITQSAEGDKNGLWTSVIAVAVLLP